MSNQHSDTRTFDPAALSEIAAQGLSQATNGWTASPMVLPTIFNCEF